MYTKSLISAVLAAGALHSLVLAAPTPKVTIVTRQDGTQECTTHLTSSIVSVGPCQNSTDSSFLDGLFGAASDDSDDGASNSTSPDTSGSSGGGLSGCTGQNLDPSIAIFDCPTPDPDDDAEDNTDGTNPSFGEPIAGLEPALGQAAGTTLTSDQVGQVAEFSQCGFGTPDFNTNLDNSTAISIAQGAPSVNVTAIAFVQNASFAAFSMSVDQTATESIFDPLNIIGGTDVTDPAAGDTTQIEVALPADLNCTGGSTGDLCLLRGENNNLANCVVLKQSKTGAAAAATRRRVARSLR